MSLEGVIRIAAPRDLGSEARWLRRLLEVGSGWPVEVVGPRDPATVVLDVGEGAPPAEAARRGERDLARVTGAYRLVVGDGRVTVHGDDSTGVFYGLQTLRQLLPDSTLRRAPLRRAGLPAPLAIDPVVIEDRPRFPWRGVHLDVCRHFMPKAFLLELVDLAALHKLNTLHLHLTDDQGWRVPIDRYPRLVEVGAWRRRSQAGHAREHRFDRTPHGGFYTKDDLREVIAHAAERHMTVVPEIEMPGHATAAIAAYPQLGATGQAVEVEAGWGVSTEVLNLEEPTVSFFCNVIDEVCDLFPGPFFHIGGDECPTTAWEASPRARELMASEGLTDPHQLQGWFTARVARHIQRNGKRIVGWDEILNAGAPEGSIIMSWQGLESGVKAASANHDVVMAPEEWLYFDWAYTDDPAEPLAIRGATPVDKVYRFDPIAPELHEDLRHHVLGAQCQLWTEYVTTPERAQYQYFPRLCAFAEVVWSPAVADGGMRPYEEFQPRLGRHLRRLDALGVNYRPLGGPTPGQARAWIDRR